MSGMFKDCTSLKSVNLNLFNTSLVQTMDYMFYYGNSLESLDLSNFNNYKVTNMHNMFGNCIAINFNKFK